MREEMPGDPQTYSTRRPGDDDSLIFHTTLFWDRGLGFFIGCDASFTEFRSLFARVSPVIQVDFLDDHVGEVGIFVQCLHDQVSHTLDKGGLLFARGTFAGDLNFYVWHS